MHPSAPHQPAAGIVIVHYNCLSDTIRCLRSLEKLEPAPEAVIVVDNASPDGSGYELQRRFSCGCTRVILNPENRGFAAANNLGMHYLRSLGCRLFWLLNPDTEVLPDSLRGLVAAADTCPGAGAFGSKILFGEPKNPAVIWGAGGEIDFTNCTVRMYGENEADNGQCDTGRACDYLPGCSLMVRSSVIDQAGPMPEEYFMYFEETEWCVRIRSAGFCLRYVPESVVLHHFDARKSKTPFTVYYYNRNGLYFWSKRASASRKVRICLRTLCQSLPRNCRALWYAPNPELRAVFLAHVRSNVDFLRGSMGRQVSRALSSSPE